MKKIVFTLLLIAVSLSSVFAEPTRKLPQDREAFINTILENTQRVNQTIQGDRQRLTTIYRGYLQKPLAFSDIRWVKNLAKAYGMKSFNLNDEKAWRSLLSRVDIIPPSMVVAQAAYESNWGRSRFAKEGNNFFGQHCYQKGCGLKPLKADPDSIMEVRQFSDKRSSIAAYILNLNSNGHYGDLRKIRADLRRQDQLISGIQLVEGLSHYSEQSVYINNIKKLITGYHFDQYDQV